MSLYLYYVFIWKLVVWKKNAIKKQKLKKLNKLHGTFTWVFREITAVLFHLIVTIIYYYGYCLIIQVSSGQIGTYIKIFQNIRPRFNFNMGFGNTNVT